MERPKRAEFLYADRFDEYCMYYSTDGFGGLVVAGSDVGNLLKLCDGNHTISQIASICDKEIEDVEKTITTLSRKGVITSNIPVHNVDSKIFDCWMHITNQCNLSCTYCYIDKSELALSYELATQAIDKIVSSCQKNGFSELHLRFSGGEPLLSFDTIEMIIDYANKNSKGLKLRYGILTNGTLISNAIIKKIKENEISISISLDGLSHYNDITRHDIFGNGSFIHVENSINALLVQGIYPSIMTTITKDNLDGIAELTDYLTDKKLRFRYSLEKSSLQFEMPKLLQYEEKLKNTLHECFSIMEAKINNGNINFEFSYCDFRFGKPIKRICSAGERSFALGSDGRLGICGMGLMTPFGHIDETDDLINTMRNQNYKLHVTSVDTYTPCRTCTWRHSCAGGCPAQNKLCYGSYMHKSPYCDVFREVLPHLLRVYGRRILMANIMKKKG